MLDLLIITKRNNHGKYFKKLAENSRLKIKLHYISIFSPFNPLQLFGEDNVGKREVCQRQLARKQKVYPRLLSIDIFKHIYWCLLYLSVCIESAQYHYLITRNKTKRIALWNGEKLPYHTVVNVAKAIGIPIIYFENGLLPNTTTVDFNGVNAKNSLPRLPQFYREFAQHARTQSEIKLYQRPTHKKRKSNLIVTLPKKYLFIPLQVPNDSQIVANSPWIKSMEQLFSTVIQAWQESVMKDYHLVFKAHPSWPNDFRHLNISNHKVLFANGNTTQELIEKAKAVITINSTVGIESLLLGKPVLTLGNACYNINNLVLHADSSDTLDEMFKLLPTWQPEESVRQGFISYLKHIYCIPQRWSQAEKIHFTTLEKRLCGEDEYSRYLDSFEHQLTNELSLNLKKTVNV